MNSSHHRLKRVVEFEDGSFGVEECAGADNWQPANWGRFPTEEIARQYMQKNTVKRIIFP